MDDLDTRNTVKQVWPVLLLVGLVAGGQTFAAEVIRCQDARGKWIFTDDKYRCPHQQGGESLQIREPNLHSRYGSFVSEEYHNYAFRAYQAIPGRSLNIIAEKKLIDSDPALLYQAIARLEQGVAAALATLPRRVHSQFNQIRYYIFTGDESRTGGRKGGLWYFRTGNGMSARFDDSIVVRSATDFMTLYDDRAAARTALHELSHAYHRYHQRTIDRDVRAAYDNAVANKLYRNVAREKGGIREKAYALTNHREYFAELSKIYHLDNAYFPFNRNDLRRYDPQGYRMIEVALGYRGKEDPN